MKLTDKREEGGREGMGGGILKFSGLDPGHSGQDFTLTQETWSKRCLSLALRLLPQSNGESDVLVQLAGLEAGTSLERAFEVPSLLSDQSPNLASCLGFTDESQGQR